MKDSGIEWIGEIPEDWGVVKSKYILKSNDGGVWGRDPTGTEKDKTVIRSTEQTIDGTWCIVNPAKRNLSGISFEKSLIRENDLLLTKSSGSSLHIGKTTLADAYFEEHECYYSNFLQRLSLKRTVFPKLYWYIFNSIFVREQFVYLQNSTSGIGNINSDNINNVIVPTLPYDMQQKIVAILDVKCEEIDKLIANQQGQIDKLKEYKQSVITEAVTKGLDPSVPMKDSGVEWIGKIPQSWEVVRLKFLLNSPMQYGANESGQLYDEKCVRYIRITDITQNGTLKNDDVLYLPLEKAADYILKDKDVLFARSGATVGKTFLFKSRFGKSAFAGYLIKADCDKEKLVPEYLMYFTQSKIYNLWKQMIFIQSTIQNIGASKYENMQVVVPNIETQQQIADYLDDKCGKIDQLIAIKQQKIDKLQQYKKSLIYEHVTGKKEVI